MNLRQMQYAVMIAEAKSFSHVAEQLSISQPALSKQIISLEQELGIKLFDRTATPLALTPAGEFFIRKARHLLQEEEQLLQTIERYKTGENGKLTIGVSPFRSIYLMPPLVQALKERFPGLQIVLLEQNSTQLHKGILEGLYDFAIMNLPVDESQLESIPLEKDTLVLAVPQKMLPCIGREHMESDEPIDLSDCASLPFIALSPGQELRRLFEKLCTLSGIQPAIDVEVTGVTTAWAMVQSGVGAAILPRQMIQNENSSVALLPLNQTTYIRQPALITKRGQYISPFAEYAFRFLQGKNTDQ